MGFAVRNEDSMAEAEWSGMESAPKDGRVVWFKRAPYDKGNFKHPIIRARWSLKKQKWVMIYPYHDTYLQQDNLIAWAQYTDPCIRKIADKYASVLQRLADR